MLPISQTTESIYMYKCQSITETLITCGEAATRLGGVAIESSRAPALVSTRKINALAEARFP